MGVDAQPCFQVMHAVGAFPDGVFDIGFSYRITDTDVHCCFSLLSISLGSNYNSNENYYQTKFNKNDNIFIFNRLHPGLQIVFQAHLVD